MSVDLTIYANHNLIFSSSQEGMSALTKTFQKEISQWNPLVGPPLATTNQIEAVGFFVNKEVLDSNFSNWKEISIFTNFEFCDKITFYEKTLKFHPKHFKTRYSEWKKFMTKEYLQDEEEYKVKMTDFDKNWEAFRAFVHHLVLQFGGNKIIYIDDNRYQEEEDGFNKGQSLQEVVALLTKKVEPYELEMLQLFPNESKVNYGWYFEDLKSSPKRKSPSTG